MKKYLTKKSMLYWLQYTILFLITAAGVFIWFALYKKSFCWTDDTLSQYLPKAGYFISYMKEWIQDIASGKPQLKMYDFTLGLGDTAFLRTEPVYWLLLLFPENMVEYGYGFLIIIRFYLAGITMSVFLRYFGLSDRQCLTGSMVYTFSGFAIYGGMRHGHFLISMIMLPLLLLAMEEIYKKKRWYLCTIFVAINLLSGYYFMYMNTIFMGIYFLIRFFMGEEERSIKSFCLRMRTIICSYLLGIGIGNFTLFNTFADYLTSSRTGLMIDQRMSLWSYGHGWVEDFYKSFLSAGMNPGYWLWLGFIPLSYICIELLFLKKGNRQLKVFFFIGTVFCMIPIFGYVFSGFSNITNRWCYGYAFVVAVITAKMLDELLHISKKEFLLILLFMLPYLYYGVGRFILGKSCKNSVLEASLVLAGIYVVLLILNSWKKLSERIRYNVIVVSAILMLWVTGAERFSPVFADMQSEFTTAGKALSTATNTPLKVMDEIQDDEFYRSYSRIIKSSVQGASMLLGHNGVLYFNSTITKSIVDFYREMGLTSWNLVRYMGFDSRGMLDALSCIRYYVKGEAESSYVPYGYDKVKDIQRDGTTYSVYENKYVLPIAYVYDKVISYEDFAGLDTAKKQEVMMQAAVVDEAEKSGRYEVVAPQNMNEQVVVTGKEIQPANVTCGEGIEYDGKSLNVTSNNSEMTFSFEGIGQAETYVVFKGLRSADSGKLDFKLSTDDDSYTTTYRYRADYNSYNTKQKDYIINLGYSENAKSYCTIQFSKKCKLTMDEISFYCQPMAPLAGYIGALKENGLQNIVVDKNVVSGTIDVAVDKLLVFSIPFQNGWKAYIDGQEVEIKNVNLMNIGIDIEPGKHEVELRFTLPGIRISMMITVAALIIFAAALIIRRRRKNAA